MQNTTIYRHDYQPPTYNAITVDLTFDLYDEHALVTSRVLLKRQREGALCLYGEELELVSLHVDDCLASTEAYRLEQGNLIITQCPDEFTLTVVTRIKPQENTTLSGLYRTKQLFCTQCEAEGFRRITYFLDRPDVLARYTTRITADKRNYPVLLSNGNLVATEDLADGRHVAVWEDPFNKPSYLFALVAGNLACVSDQFITCTGKLVELRIYVEPGNEDKCAHAMQSLKKAMRWDEEQYGREYDLSIYMIVAVSDFNMGAMENKGLNIFNAKYVLARPDTATDQDFSNVEEVIGHEYFHNWTGNRVTCRDWFQLSLKEGLTVFREQEFARDMNSREVYRIEDVRLLRHSQFPEDGGSMAHPVRPESYQEINNFYTATIYNKGAEVIRMQETLLGKAGFRRGMDLYFKQHDGQAVTIDDFVAAMEEANDADLGQFKLWYSQAGTPEITVESHYADGVYSLTCKQSCRPTPESPDKKPFHIPLRVGLLTANGEAIPLAQDVLELKQAEQTFRFENLSGKPLLSFLRDFSAPVIVHRKLKQQEALALLRHDPDGFAKWDVAQQLAIDTIVACYKQAPNDWHVSEELLQAYQHVLSDETLDASLRANLLTPPGFEDIASRLSDIDVERVEAAHLYFRTALGKHLYDQAQAHYEKTWKEEDHAMHALAYKRRELRNRCLGLMMRGDEARALSWCQQQYAQAKTMTDQLTGFALLVNCSQTPIRQQAIADFYHQWKQEELVLDKWFAIQASCEQPGVLSEVKALLQHPDFNIKNPNKVRSVIGAFVANTRYFHAVDGSGYQFLTDYLITLDKINPQIAARLATPFTRLQRLNATLRGLMKQQLERLAGGNLSADLGEVVNNCLGVAR